MTRHYGPSTRRRMGDLDNGIRVQTSTLLNTAVLAGGTTGIFTVNGRILVKQLYIEAITVFSADATTALFRFTSTTPAIGISNMTGASGVLTSIAQGIKVKYLGGAVVTGLSINVGEACATPHIIGTATTAAGVQGVGVISILAAGANQTGTASCQVVIDYVPMEPGSSVVSLL